jgi:hypothetical protein
MSNDETRFRHQLEVEVEADLFLVESSHPEEVLAQPESEWLFDPTDAVREEVGLRSLLGAVEAVEALEAEPRPEPRPEPSANGA